MTIGVDISSLKRSDWTDYVTRFLCGGIFTALTGLLAKRYGPVVAGLFLAFPAIFPAGATLIEKHEKQKKREVGLDGTSRGSAATSIDAAGAAMGSLGLIAFAVLVWRLLPKYPSLPILIAAGLAWLLTSVVVWWLRKIL